MGNGIWVAASGAAGQMTALDATANNLANANTTAYKADVAVFQEHLIAQMHGGHASQHMRLSGVAETSSKMQQGALEITERPLDVAIRGDGFFSVQTPAGERFTRAGNFQIQRNGTLSTVDGQPVLNPARRPISVPPNVQNVEIARDGTIRADGSDIGRLRVVQFENPASLQKEGALLFRPNEQSGQPAVVQADLATGALELSNISIVNGMTDIVSTTRTFDALNKVIETFSELERRAATDIAKT